MAAVMNHLWRQIIRSSAEGIRFAVTHLFREAKVDQFDVPVDVDQYILWFEVSVCDALDVVKVFYCQCDFGSVKFGCCVAKGARASEVAEDFAAGAVIQLARSDSFYGIKRIGVATYQHIQRLVV